MGKVAYADDDYAINQDLTGLIVKDPKQLNNKFLFYSVKPLGSIIDKNAQGMGVRGVTRDFLSKLKIALPSLETQKKIVALIEREQMAVDSTKQLISLFEQKIRDKIASVWEN